MHRSIVGVLVTVLSLVIVSLLAADASAACGNGILEAGECCDDGNTVNGDGCNTDCTCPKTCCNDPTQQCVTDADCAKTGAAGSCGCDDHLKCYKVTDPLALKGIVDLNSPQFGLEAGCKIKKATKFCVPATKTVKSAHVGKTTIVPVPIGGQELSDDYICYSISCPKPVPPDTAVVDQFGRRTLKKFKAFELCGPAKKCPLAVSQLISTGIETLPGNSDPFWHLTVSPAPPLPACTDTGLPAPPTRRAVVAPPGVEIVPIAGTQWISTDAACTATLECQSGDYTYELCWNQCGPLTFEGFCTGGSNSAQHCSIASDCPGGGTCDWLTALADNSADVFLVHNGGTPLPIGTVPGFSTPASIPFASPGEGTNCLQVVVHNSPSSFSPCFGSPTGMDLRGIISGRVQILP